MSLLTLLCFALSLLCLHVERFFEFKNHKKPFGNQKQLTPYSSRLSPSRKHRKPFIALDNAPHPHTRHKAYIFVRDRGTKTPAGASTRIGPTSRSVPWRPPSRSGGSAPRSRQFACAPPRTVSARWKSTQALRECSQNAVSVTVRALHLLRLGYWRGTLSLLSGSVVRSRGNAGPSQALRTSWSLGHGSVAADDTEMLRAQLTCAGRQMSVQQTYAGGGHDKRTSSRVRGWMRTLQSHASACEGSNGING